MAICRLSPDAARALPTPQSTFWSITRTTDELSVVCGEDEAPAGATCNPGWRALKLEGPFDLDAVGGAALDQGLVGLLQTGGGALDRNADRGEPAGRLLGLRRRVCAPGEDEVLPTKLLG